MTTDEVQLTSAEFARALAVLNDASGRCTRLKEMKALHELTVAVSVTQLAYLNRLEYEATQPIQTDPRHYAITASSLNEDTGRSWFKRNRKG